MAYETIPIQLGSERHPLYTANNQGFGPVTAHLATDHGNLRVFSPPNAPKPPGNTALLTVS